MTLFLNHSNAFIRIYDYLELNNKPMNCRKFTIALFATIVVIQMQAQEKSHSETLSSGGSVSNSNGSISYSIGQVLYTERANASNSINQGIQNVYEISIITGKENHNVELLISAYPNPTVDYLNLVINDLDSEYLEFVLIDMKGQLIKSSKISSQQIKIDMNSCISGVYLLIVKDGDKSIKKFKIIKK